MAVAGIKPIQKPQQKKQLPQLLGWDAAYNVDYDSNDLHSSQSI